MTVSKIRASFACGISRVWETVTDVESYPQWRSDLGRTEVLNEKQFVEYTKDGYATTFTVTANEPYKRWEFDMENGNMSGHWSGVFTLKGEETEIEFTESVTVKKFFMKPLAGLYLKKQQNQFVSDLKRALVR